MTLLSVTLDDKYALPTGQIYLSGLQALVRLPVMQRQRDLAAGLDTAGFISGYRGSPLGIYDTALQNARHHLEENNIRFEPGLNEDLAATAVWGSQQVNMFPGARYDGVFGIWYGKGPGVDRSIDAIKHANAAGTSKHGGVLALMGDDHGAHSSTMPHQSEFSLISAMVPILSPAAVHEFLDLGLLGFALSRFSGCWVGFKCAAQTVETAASLFSDIQQPEIVIPDFEMPPGGLNIRYPDPPLEQEARLHGPRMRAVAAFARANQLDRVVIDSPAARLGIATTGKAYLDVREALCLLGLDETKAARIGLRLYKVGMIWPLEGVSARSFAAGLQEVLVIEEKRGLVEDQLALALYNMPADVRPRVIGKRDADGSPLVPSTGELNPVDLAVLIGNRLSAYPEACELVGERLTALRERAKRARGGHPIVVRPPFFCSGCPHNTSTRVPEGSRALAGIGCHGMVVFMPERRTHVWSHMGGEGAAWIGQAPFTDQPHIFQNLGDGTYSHSGLLAIRAAAAAGVNITYKILYNDAVAMTGGQAVESRLDVPLLTRQVAAEGAKRIVVVTDEPSKYPKNAGFAPAVEIRSREELDAVQLELRATPGLTILIYDQTCAAEKRRRRKRGSYPDPARRYFINEDVCEGCGDCSVKSNCISVLPVETSLGRKRRIDQSNCNKDYSCAKGFCPSFVTVDGGTLVKAAKRAGGNDDPASGLPLPCLPSLEKPYGILIAGIGGTGVVTVGALLGMAAHLEGKACTVMDNMGMAQKNGAVMSHVRLACSPEALHASRITAGGAKLLLACDLVVATGSAALSTVEPGSTRAVANADVAPTAAFVVDNNIDFREAEMRRRLAVATGEGGTEFVAATRLATSLIGDSVGTNLFLLGYAFQRGLVPLGLEALHRAIELNGVAVAASKAVFAWGRRAAVDLAAVEATAATSRGGGELSDTAPTDLAGIVAHRSALLEAYQDRAYADAYRAFVARVEVAERARTPGARGLTEAVARNLAKLMAYKDEYEVARLYTDGAFERRLRAQFNGDFRLSLNLAPPLLARRDPATGEPKKIAFGPWSFRVLRVLARLKHLRGTAFDPFGMTKERRTERALIGEYRARIEYLLDRLTPENHAVAVEIAELPDRIRGFGHIKMRNLAAVREAEARLLEAFEGPVVRT